MQRSLYRLVIARSDIAAAMEGCDHLINGGIRAGHPLYWTMHNGIVVSYARPFTQNRPFGPLPAKWSTFDTRYFEELHRELLELRRKCVAHSDHDMRKVFIVPPGASMLDGDTNPNMNLGTAVQNWALPPAKWRDVRDLCLNLGSSLSLEAETLLQLLYSGGRYEPVPFELTPEIA